MNILPKLVTEPSTCFWNQATGTFESKIFITNPVTGIKTLAEWFATPPRTFILSVQSRREAIEAYHSENAGATIIDFGDLRGKH